MMTSAGSTPKISYNTYERQYEQEEIRQRENQQKIPEFVRVKDNLRRTPMSDQ